jgi:hypothetical protein
MKLLAIAVVLLAGACSKSKETPPASGGGEQPAPNKGSAAPAPDKGSAPAPDKGSAVEPAKGSAVEPAKGSGDAAGSGSGGGSGAAGFDFKKLTHAEQKEFMKTKVMPAMKTAFQKFDPKEFKNFTCKTCHGKDPEKAKFKMPNPGAMAKLDFAALKAGKQEPKTAEFMAKVVKPEMAKILNVPEYTEDKPDGFGCLHCHEMKK